MEAQWLAEYPHQGADKRLRERQRLAWDAAPTLFQPPKAIPMLYCGQELINGNFTTAFLPPPPIYYPGPPRNLSPPWRPDDKDGHYVFVVGENLTPRYRILSKMGEGTFGQVLECWDLENQEAVAIKIVRSLQKYREAAMIELMCSRDLGSMTLLAADLLVRELDFSVKKCIIAKTCKGQKASHCTKRANLLAGSSHGVVARDLLIGSH